MDSPEDAAIIAEAKKRFERVKQRESKARKRFIEDVKFANGDSRNNYQWDDTPRKSREAEKKPCFTINKTRQHNLQIINEARQNKQSVKIRPVGGGASYDSAQIFEGVVRHIEYQSRAQAVYQSAIRSQVQGGVGYWRIVTDYVDEDSFDQEIFIRRVKDPLSVYLDPDTIEPDRSDARFGFVFEEMAKEEAEKKWPDLKDRFPKTALANSDGWFGEDTIRIAEYFRVTEETDELVALQGPDGSQGVRRLSEIADDEQFKDVKPKQIRKALETMGARFRKVSRPKIEWFKIAGDVIVDRKPWPGKYIPIVMVVGEETIIDGELDRKGHTRALLDAQRNYNYWTSEAAAQVALQNKSPYITDARAIEGHEKIWRNANRDNFAYLPFNGVDAEGNELRPPERQNPPVMAQAYIQGMNTAAEELRMVSGQYQETVGANSNAQSGVAINARQRAGDNATYHYIDHQGIALAYTGMILIDLIPKIYDTQRVLKIMADDGSQSEIHIDPKQTQAYMEHKSEEAEEVKAIFNPSVGKYEVESDVGPSFATKRQEAFNALSQIAQQSPQLMQIAGDLVMQAADFPYADEMAERLRRMVPPQALGEDQTPPQVAQLQQQLQTAQQFSNALAEKLKDAQAQLKERGDELTVKAYDAETKRLAALEKSLPLDPEGLMRLVQQAVRDAIGMALPQEPQGSPLTASAPSQALPPQMDAQGAQGAAPAPQTAPQPDMSNDAQAPQ